jgi:hypothetical protein
VKWRARIFKVVLARRFRVGVRGFGAIAAHRRDRSWERRLHEGPRERNLMKKIIAPLIVLLALAFGAGTADAANKYINDINWSQIKCVLIPGYVQQLEQLGDHLDEAAEDARDAGQDGLAAVYQTAANEAHLEADEGRMAYWNGNCVGD